MGVGKSRARIGVSRQGFFSPGQTGIWNCTKYLSYRDSKLGQVSTGPMGVFRYAQDASIGTAITAKTKECDLMIGDPPSRRSVQRVGEQPPPRFWLGQRRVVGVLAAVGREDMRIAEVRVVRVHLYVPCGGDAEAWCPQQGPGNPQRVHGVQPEHDPDRIARTVLHALPLAADQSVGQAC